MNNTEKNEKVIHPPLSEIIPSATNRQTFPAASLNEMCDSILEKGVLQPIIVRPVTAIEDEARRAAALKTGAKYELVAGDQRGDNQVCDYTTTGDGFRIVGHDLAPEHLIQPWPPLVIGVTKIVWV